MVSIRRKYLILSVLLFTSVCGGSEPQKPQAEKKAQTLPPENPYADEVAKYLAGVALPESSALKPLTQTATYAAYKADANKSWARYKRNALDKIAAWRKEHIREQGNETLFYPFSGPDMLHAAAFFPDKKEYILLALEPAGKLPDPKKIPQPDIGLLKLKGTLQNILGMGFFHTKVMEWRVGSHPFSTITGVILFFLSRHGYEVAAVNPISLNSDGSVQYNHASESSVQGVHIRFRRPGKQIQSVYYFPGDVSDSRFHAKKSLVAFLQKRTGFTTLMKAASYLTYRPTFDDMRNFILSNSTMVVTDASGIPLHYFEPHLWKLDFYGKYIAPIPLFANRCQPDLKKTLAEKSKGVLPFQYGYQFRHGQSHLIVAHRNYPLEGDKQKWDKSSVIGENTYCIGDTLTIAIRP